MLKAILHGKAGRIEHNKDESVSWSSLFKAREDLLTSTVFERFSYLSDSVQNHLIQHWFSESRGIALAKLGEFESISYWPRFEHQHERGTNQVEPDLIIHFTHCNILVEVKPPEGGIKTLVNGIKKSTLFCKQILIPISRFIFSPLVEIKSSKPRLGRISYY